MKNSYFAAPTGGPGGGNAYTMKSCLICLRTRMQQAVAIMLLCVIVTGCSNSNKHHFPVTGKYATHLPSRMGVPILRLQYGGHIFPMLLIHLYLRPDSCFVTGTCNCQIWQAGRYRVTGNTVRLYDIFDFQAQTHVPDNEAIYDPENNRVLFRYYYPDTTRIKQAPQWLATLVRDWPKGGFDMLRNEDWPLDSLVKFNTLWDGKAQSRWVDSMMEVKHITVMTH